MVPKQLAPIAKRKFHAGPEVLYECAIRLAELRQRPEPHGIQAALPLVVNAFGVAGLPAQQPIIGVAHHHRAAQAAQARHYLARLRATLDGVAEADKLIARLGREIC
jgi:hypothetical protein